jgi:hypothetical protein
VNQVRSKTYNGSTLIELLRQHVPHDFDPDDFLIAGSARLWAGRMTTDLSDLDILARPDSDTWHRAVEIANEHAREFGTAAMRTSDYSGAKIAQLHRGAIEVCDIWVLPGCDTEKLLANAEEFGGLKYLSVQAVIDYKRYLARPKDYEDLRLLATYEYEVGSLDGLDPARPVRR